MTPRPMTRAQAGFGVMSALVVLVLLAALAALVVRLGFTENITSAQNTNSARAEQGASTGVEWGLYQAFKGSWTTCPSTGATATLDQRADMGVWVTVTCKSSTYSEGASAENTPSTVRVYQIDAVACNGTSSCPDDARVGQPGYVERKRSAQAVSP